MYVHACGCGYCTQCFILTSVHSPPHFPKCYDTRISILHLKVLKIFLKAPEFIPEQWPACMHAIHLISSPPQKYSCMKPGAHNVHTHEYSALRCTCVCTLHSSDAFDMSFGVVIFRLRAGFDATEKKDSGGGMYVCETHNRCIHVRTCS